jgi:hypothetical protein
MLDVDGERRLGDVEEFGGAGEVAETRNGDKRTHLPQIDIHRDIVLLRLKYFNSRIVDLLPETRQKETAKRTTSLKLERKRDDKKSIDRACGSFDAWNASICR